MILPKISTPGDWRLRRRVMNAWLGFCMLVVGVCVVLGGDANSAPLRAAISTACILSAGGIVVAYCGFATLDDHNARKAAAANAESAA